MLELTPWSKPVDTEIRVPGDKSLTHRGILMSAVADGAMTLNGWLDAGDTRSSLRLVQALGVEVLEDRPGQLVLQRRGRLSEPAAPIDCGNSGTTMRLGCGLVTAVDGMTVLTGDGSLIRRPMARVADPLRALGVRVMHRHGGVAPLVVQGGPHRGGEVVLAVASAQVKSAVLLAGLTADAPVTVEEPVPTRDHTERMVRAMGGHILQEGTRVTIFPGVLKGLAMDIAGDPSSAAFWAALAAIQPNRRVTLDRVLLNPGRTGFFRILERMGAQLTVIEQGSVPEPWGRVTISGGALRAFSLEAPDIPSMVDEVPLAALLATQCHGVTEIRGAEELRVKESDRIRVTTDILRALGASVEELRDGWVIEGPTPLKGTRVHAQGDHRMAMMAAVASTAAASSVVLEGEDSVAISYPGFFEQFHRLQHA